MDASLCRKRHSWKQRYPDVSFTYLPVPLLTLARGTKDLLPIVSIESHGFRSKIPATLTPSAFTSLGLFYK